MFVWFWLLVDLHASELIKSILNKAFCDGGHDGFPGIKGSIPHIYIRKERYFITPYLAPVRQRHLADLANTIGLCSCVNDLSRWPANFIDELLVPLVDGQG